MEETVRIASEGALKVKVPVTSVAEPIVVPLMMTPAPITGSPCDVTFPFTSICSDWAKRLKEETVQSMNMQDRDISILCHAPVHVPPNCAINSVVSFIIYCL